MPKMFGYNRWCASWPENISCYERYPLVMLGSGAWPYNWIGQRRQAGVNWDFSRPEFPFLVYKGYFFGQQRWDCLPPILGFPSVTNVTADLRGTLEEPAGILWTMRNPGQSPQRYDDAFDYIEYEKPYDFESTPQKDIFGFFLINPDDPFFDWAEYVFKIPDYCGQEWPPR